ncbi:HxlR family transcriptional regulator [Amycolatopsis echigonensis]|uniref:HxlR family transcriptional regulator n=1 Tax=Amycolatopsis echigonensis TaxID=2576905 RepID=A0A2N3X1I1_9PSEU|nr:helix-turn-helix domain-containing protein [Amycolatopsis niigatensis]PKV99954.1 HxlR family transcriptional regulator [Amycolatopsis niigatensis]
MSEVTPKPAVPPRIREGGAVREVLDRIGDKWSMLVVGTLRAGPRRFGELEQAIAGVSQRMLTLTLRRLVEDGLVARTAFAEVPPRVEYELTDLGRTLVPLVMALAEWAMAHREEINAHRSRYRADTADGPGGH